MKKIFIMFLFIVGFSTIQNVNASTKDKIFFEESSYFEEVVDSQGNKKIKELTEKEYNEKKLHKEKIKEEKIKKDKILADNYDAGLLSSIELFRVIEGGGGGGGITRTSKVYTPNSTMTNLYCTENYYYYCEGSAERNNPMTKLHLVVSYDPRAKTGMRAEATLTWDGAPSNSIQDFLSISYDGIYVSADDNTIIGKQTVVFDEVIRYWWGGVKSRTEHSNYEEFDYDPNSPDFEYTYHGVIFNVKKVYKDYIPADFEFADFPPLYKDNGYAYSEVEIITAEYKVEFDVDLKGDYDSYEDVNKIAFAADYRHTKYGVQLNPKLTVRAYLTPTKPAAFMNLDLTIQIIDDGSRRITLDLYN